VLLLLASAGALVAPRGALSRRAMRTTLPSRRHAQPVDHADDGASREPPSTAVDALLVRELDLVLDMLKARSGAELDLSDADIDDMRARGAELLIGLGAEISDSYANVSETISARIAASMAEERVAALNTFNERTAAVRKEMQSEQAQLRADMRRVAELEAELGGRAEAGDGGLARRGTTAVATVAVLLGVYNGGLSLWRGLAFDGGTQADVLNGSLDLVGAAIGALVLWRISTEQKAR
jgi:hypothetical protein